MRSKSALPSTIRCVLALVLGAILGNRVRRWLYCRLLGYEIDRSASLGISFLRVVQVSLAPHSSIGHFSVIRNLHSLRLDENACIGTFNWIFGMIRNDSHFVEENDRVPELIMEAESALTSRHIIDCTNRVVIGAFSTVSGFQSQILTHGIDIDDSRQRSSPVIIGRYCLIGTGCIILKGSIVPDGSIVGAGSVFRGQPSEAYHLYSGVPAKPVKVLSPTQGYFTRKCGAVR